ncbi:MAG: primosomal protein N' [Pseudomonadota bacterium]
MIVDVVVPFRVNSSFHYRIDPELANQLNEGSIVEVPLGSKKTHAFVIGFPKNTDVPEGKLKDVCQVLKREPVFDPNMMRLLRWTAEYYCHPLGEVFDAAIPRSNLKPRKRKTAPKIKEIDFGLLGKESAEKPDLTLEQKSALEEILNPSETRPILLHGVTGSGKTEIYLRTVEAVLAQDKGAIILVPEIALTPQLMGRFAARFPGQVAVLHSDLTPSERSRQWDRLFQGEARVVVGARSAIFAPVKKLGLIVVDEEQESSFKQEDSLRYHARDLAVVRGKFENAKVILGSATPSLESYSNATSGRYCYVQLKKRVHDQPLPRTTLVDVKDKTQWYQAKTPWLSRYLVERLEATLSSKKQAILYLNRLGFAHFLFCRDCGHTYRCKNCDVALTYYQSPPFLKCHYCGMQQAVPKQCDECEGTELDSMGLGTEQVERQLQSIFPKARIGRMDRSRIKNRKDLEILLHSISKGEMDFIIGTQMVAKGHDFPGISLVGILMADASLNIPDFRANERTFQIITQVSGRAGRAGEPGEVIIQTLNPQQPTLRWASENKTVDFYTTELNARKLFSFPPFQRLALLRFQHSDSAAVQRYAEEIARLLRTEIRKNGYQCQILGPSEAPISKLKSLYRWQCLIKAVSVKELQVLLRTVNHFDMAAKNRVKLAVDVDPINSL